MIRAAVNGVCGRMGRIILALALDDEDIEVVAGLERPDHPDLGADIEMPAGRPASRGLLLPRPVSSDTVPEVSQSLTEDVDVLIDFTTPDATMNVLRTCAESNTAMVIGTTGHSREQRAAIEEAAKKIPIVLAPNMSAGVNVMFELTRRAAELLDERYDVEVVEAHHRFKKDAPSGTARRLVEMIARGRGIENPGVTYGREGMVGERGGGEIGVHSVRAGDIVGDHTVMFATLGERIEITHRAHSREGFARGAILAAKYVVGKPARLYTMRDVLAIR